MTEAQFRQHWIGKVFRAETPSAPKIAYSNESAIEQVARTPGGIGLVQAPVTAKNVKVIRIDGRAPGKAATGCGSGYCGIPIRRTSAWNRASARSSLNHGATASCASEKSCSSKAFSSWSSAAARSPRAAYTIAIDVDGTSLPIGQPLELFSTLAESAVRRASAYAAPRWPITTGLFSDCASARVSS